MSEKPKFRLILANMGQEYFYYKREGKIYFIMIQLPKSFIKKCTPNAPLRSKKYSWCAPLRRSKYSWGVSELCPSAEVISERKRMGNLLRASLEQWKLALYSSLKPALELNYH